MKVHLLFEDQDTDVGVSYTPRDGFQVLGRDATRRELDITQDLELTTLFTAMAGGDRFLFAVARQMVLTSLNDPDAIRFRQAVLGDCIEHPQVIRDLFDLAKEAVTAEWRTYRALWESPSSVLSRSVEVLRLSLDVLRRLRKTADTQAENFSSPGFTHLFAGVQRELDDEFFAALEEHLSRLRFKDGMLFSARLGKGVRGTDEVLRAPTGTKRSFRERIGLGPRTAYSFEIAPRDEAGFRALNRLNDRGVNLAGNAVAQSADHIKSFFAVLCVELAFYVGCLNLLDRLVDKGEPWCLPTPAPWHAGVLSFQALYEVCLALRTDAPVVGNDADADRRSLLVITGANSGGKSTFLRSVGVAQLMMQCGMFVGAHHFRASVCDGLFTHFIREEDETMTSGRFDEELARMSAIAKDLTPRCMMLFNESFAATNEREGSEIAGQIVQALLESDIRVLYVTHLFDFADRSYREHTKTALFLRAERGDDGQRTYKLVEGRPLPTSYGEDLFRRLGGWSTNRSATARTPVGGPPLEIR